MPNAKKAKIMVEQGRSLVDFAALTDSGDHQHFTAADDVFSGKEGFEPEVLPDGVKTGLNLMTPEGATVNKVSVAACTVIRAGAEVSVAAADVTIVRPATLTHIINSVVVTAGAFAVVTGTEGEAFSAVRGAAGGPPFIPIGSSEVGQTQTAAQADALITEDEIKQVIGQHHERFDYPGFKVDPIGLGINAKVAATASAHVKMSSALPLIHTGSLPKEVYAKYYTPEYTELELTSDFSPAEMSHSISTEEVYNDSETNESESLGQAGFKVLLNDGTTDAFVREANEVITVKFFPNRNKSPYKLTQGRVALKTGFPVKTGISAAVTISAKRATANFSG